VKRQVILAEVMTPLRHAVRLVDCDDRDRYAAQECSRFGLYESFRCDVQQVQFVVPQPLNDLLLCIVAQRRVQERRIDAELVQRADLVLHQCDQRRDDQTDAVAQQRRDLVAQRFAAAGRHQHERIPARHRCIDDHFLLAAKFRVAEGVLQEVQWISAVLMGD